MVPKRLAVFISWKDIRNPNAGGAELVHQEWSKRLVRDGYRVIHLVPGFSGCAADDVVDDIEIKRFGKNVLSFYATARHYRQYLCTKADLLIDVFNCFGSFAVLSGARGKTLFAIHHIQDRMWFYQTSFAGVPRWLMPFINLVGYVVEKLQLAVLAQLHRGPVVTVSDSTARELTHYGFRRERIEIVHNGCALTPLTTLDESLPKRDRFTVLMIGPRKSKRPMHVMKAFELFHRDHPDTHLVIAGWGTEDPILRAYAAKRGIRNVEFTGRFDEETKRRLLQQCHVLCTTPVKEGWGLIVNEANAMGTPVIGYDVAGLRDALAFGNGVLCNNTPSAMADAIGTIRGLWEHAPEKYQDLREKALASSRQWSFDRSYEELLHAIGAGGV